MPRSISPPIPLPSQDHLLRYFSYDPHSGELRWKIAHRGTSVGDLAGYVSPQGYWRVSIDGTQFPAQRIIWKLMTGCEPKDFIDHKDGNKANNKWSNLRSATKKDNAQNCRKYVTNTSSVKGVTWDKKLQKWKVVINANNVRHYLGLFENFTDAATARDVAAEHLHGAYARRE